MKLVPFNEDYVHCDNTKSNWRYDHSRFDAIREQKRRPKIESTELH